MRPVTLRNDGPTLPVTVEGQVRDKGREARRHAYVPMIVAHAVNDDVVRADETQAEATRHWQSGPLE
jgi:hypothetical protein